MPHVDWRWLLSTAGVIIGFVVPLVVAPPMVTPVLLLAFALGLGAGGGAIYYRASEGRVMRLLAVALIAGGLFAFIGSAFTFVTVPVDRGSEATEGVSPPGLLQGTSSPE